MRPHTIHYGEERWNAKLSDAVVQDIIDARREHDRLKREQKVYKDKGYGWRTPEVQQRAHRIKELSYASLGRKYGVHPNTVWKVAMGLSWTHRGEWL